MLGLGAGTKGAVGVFPLLEPLKLALQAVDLELKFLGLALDHLVVLLELLDFLPDLIHGDKDLLILLRDFDGIDSVVLVGRLLELSMRLAMFDKDGYTISQGAELEGPRS
jgi:hypothetical protein